MELSDALTRRRMVRRYLPDPVDADDLDAVTGAFMRAPSAGHTQAAELVVVTETDRRRAIADACGEREAVARGRAVWLSDAPVHLIVCTSPAAYARRYAEDDKATARGPEGWATPWWWVDAGAGLGYVLLAAADRGLGAGVLDLADPDRIATLVGLPAEVVPVGLVTVGHPHPEEMPVGSAVRRPRRSATERVHREVWGSGA